MTPTESHTLRIRRRNPLCPSAVPNLVETSESRTRIVSVSLIEIDCATFQLCNKKRNDSNIMGLTHEYQIID
jgi:hypothetical protein